MDFLKPLVENIKAIGACAAAVTTCTGAWVLMDWPMPASRQWVLQHSGTLISQAQAQDKATKDEVRDIKTRVLDMQLQQNSARREAARSSRYRAEQDLRKEPNDEAAMRQRDQIGDTLEEIERERDILIRERNGK